MDLYVLLSCYFICFIIAIYMLIIRLFKKNEVIKYGKRYNKIIKINSQYNINDIYYKYILKYQATSKRNLDNFDLKKYAIMNIKDNYKNILQAVDKVDEWLTIYKQYLKDYYNVLNSNIKYNEKDIIRIKHFDNIEKFISFEKMMCEEAKINNHVRFILLVKADYISPKRRNHWKRSISYSFRDVKSLIVEANQIENKKTFAEYQRTLMSPKLRYKILKRDNYTCQLCGRKASDGYQMEVDHIMPVSKGGKTLENNLQVLCWDCNHGKLDEYDVENTGFKCSKVFTLDLGDNFDTSNVTSMEEMFYNTGYWGTVFELDLGDKFDTSNVADMSRMFYNTGYSNEKFTLKLGNKFDTSKVTDMSGMFYKTGYSSPNFTLDLGNKFNTSNVTDMSRMFCNTGYSSSKFTLNLGKKFDTSKVANMSYMFAYTGYSSPKFTLKLGDKFDTSKVTNMSFMFFHTGRSSSSFTLDLGKKFDTSKVTNMSYMFYFTGFINPNFTLELGKKFDMSNVSDTSYMFFKCGWFSTKMNITLNITFNKPYVSIGYYSMFTGTAERGSQITVNYTSATSSLVDLMIATKNDGANVVKGVQLD